MTQEEKKEFDWLNSSSYLLRLLLERKGFEITKNASSIWHVFYDGHIVGSLTYRHDDDYNYTFTNLRLYKYLIHKEPKLKDFIMSEYFERDGNKLLRFDFDGFNKYLDEIIEVFPPKQVKTEDVEDEVVDEEDDIEDSISRLQEYCDEFDEKFSKNTLYKDIQCVLKDYNKLKEKVWKQEEKENTEE